MNTLNPPVSLFCQSAPLEENAKKLAKRFGFVFQGLLDDKDATFTSSTFLNLTSSALMLHSPQMKPWAIDFLSPERQYRRKQGGGFQETLARACGIKKNKPLPTILDLTAGTGNDAFVLACLGCPVTLVERDPIVAALLEDALQRFYNDSQSSNIHMTLYFGEAEDFLRRPDIKCPDIVYYDPMHPQRKKSACVKKEMQLLQQWLSPEENPEHLLSMSLKYAQKRVVLKWPRKIPFHSAYPHFTYQENTICFHVFTPRPI